MKLYRNKGLNPFRQSWPQKDLAILRSFFWFKALQQSRSRYILGFHIFGFERSWRKTTDAWHLSRAVSFFSNNIWLILWPFKFHYNLFDYHFSVSNRKFTVICRERRYFVKSVWCRVVWIKWRIGFYKR